MRRNRSKTSMYEAFFGLRERPFNLTPDPRFLFLSEKHKEAFAHLLYGIKNRSGFVMVTGEIGTGKTTISRTLLQQLHDDTEIAFIFNPFLSPEELLRKINEDFGIESKGETIKDLVDELNAYLLDRGACGKNCILVIDEAQDLAPNVLEHVRLLSNLETETQKLLQIILIGQPELAQHLELPELRQLNQRITARYHLFPLDRSETVQYIAFRLRAAGGLRKIRFTRGALRAVYRYSGGVPRVINSICDRALLVAYTQEARDITVATVRKAAQEVRGQRVVAPQKRQPRRWRAWAPAPVFVLLALVLAMAANVAYEWAADRKAMAPSTTERSDLMDRDPLAARAVAAGEVLAREAAQGSESSPALVRAQRSLDEALLSLDSVTARNAAAAGLLHAWNMALLGGYPEGDDLSQLAKFAAVNGLTLTPVQVSVEQLAAIGLPAFVRIAGDREVLWLGVVGIDNDQIRLTARVGEIVPASWNAFAARYQRQAAILWRDAGGAALRKGMTGDAVQELQRRLKAAGLLQNGAPGVFDDATNVAVQELQRLTGLNVDGVVGSNTRMVLESWGGGAVREAFAGGKARMLAARAASSKGEVSAASTAPIETDPSATSVAVSPSPLTSEEGAPDALSSSDSGSFVEAPSVPAASTQSEETTG